MKDRLSFLLTAIFLVISALHFYWLFGGQWGFHHAIPTDINGNKVLNPSTIDTLVVGLGLLFFALFYFSQTMYSFLKLPRWIVLILGWFIPIIFLIRSVGDFQYIGFFKAVTATDFGRMDTILYTPLCLVIGVSGLLVISKK